MKNADRLIISLDFPDHFSADGQMSWIRHWTPRLYELGIHNYKISITNLMMGNWREQFVFMVTNCATQFMLDAKSYDTPDTITRMVKHAGKHMGSAIKMMTVAPKRKVVDAAVLASSNTGIDILPVPAMTSDVTFDHKRVMRCLEQARMMVFPPWWLAPYKAMNDSQVILVVCPGIRLGGEQNNHHRTMTPGEAILAGADYIVVGRPIINSIDPVETARRYIENIG